jgi:hypothetical protein
VPWNRLPGVFVRDDGNYAGGYFALMLKQFYGPQPRGGNAPQI